MMFPTTVYRIVTWCSFLSMDMLSYDIDATDPAWHDWTALMYATYYDNLPAVDSLLKKGASINLIDDEMRTSLFIGVQESSSIALLTSLLKYGADVEQGFRTYGYTPLMQASTIGYLDAVMLLLEYGADKTAISNRNWTAYDYAESMGYTDIMAVLM